MVKITQKQVKLLQVLMGRPRVVADFIHADLCSLRNMGLVGYESAFCANGRLSRNAIWWITDAGRRFLDEERAGQ